MTGTLTETSYELVSTVTPAGYNVSDDPAIVGTILKGQTFNSFVTKLAAKAMAQNTIVMKYSAVSPQTGDSYVLLHWHTPEGRLIADMAWKKVVDSVESQQSLIS